MVMTLPRGARALVVSELRLVAESVAVALSVRGVETVSTPWPPASEPRSRCGTDGHQADVGLVLSELADAASVHKVRSVIRWLPVPWVVVTSAPRGAAWGAVLEIGADTVLSDSTTLDDLADTLVDVRQGRSPIGTDLRRQLVDDRLAAVEELERLRARLSALSLPERSVLRLLCSEPSFADLGGQEIADPGQRRLVASVLLELDRVRPRGRSGPARRPVPRRPARMPGPHGRCRPSPN
jgi:DNA-binding NarL/FixJ family response regulator